MVANRNPSEPGGLDAGGDELPSLQPGDRIELSYKDTPATTISATVRRLLTDRDKGMSPEIEDYTACWIEISPDESSDTASVQAVLLGTDFQFRLNGRPVSLRKGQA